MDILQWAVEMWRNPDKDRSEALSRTAEECRQEFCAGLADYDAFVEDALTVTDGIYLGDAVSSRGEVIPIRMRWDEEYVHWIMQGTTGMGKTKKAISVAIQKLQRNPPRVGSVDFKSDFHSEVIRWCAAIGQTLDPISRGELHDRLIVVNQFADALFPLNVCRLLRGSTAE